MLSFYLVMFLFPAIIIAISVWLANKKENRNG